MNIRYRKLITRIVIYCYASMVTNDCKALPCHENISADQRLHTKWLVLFVVAKRPALSMKFYKEDSNFAADAG